MANQSLVPKNLEYGERQNQVASRSRAGLPLDPSPQSAPQAAVSPAGPEASPTSGGQARPSPLRQSSFDPLLDADPSMFPATVDPNLAARPMQATMTPQQYAYDLASRSQNGLLRAVAARRAQRQ